MPQHEVPASSGRTVDRKMIFVTGASRSGTTLLSCVLRNHGQVFGLNELHYFGEVCDPRYADHSFHTDAERVSAAAAIFEKQENGVFSDRPSARSMSRARLLIDSLPAADRTPAGIFAAAVLQLANEAGKSIACEQTPRNIFYAGTLLDMYPEARFVHMLRDPRAVMSSQKKRWKRRLLAADKKKQPLYESLRSWVNYHPYTMADLWLRASKEATRLASHPRFTIARFEDLVGDPEKTIRFLCRRLDIEFDPRMLDVSQINSSHQSSVGGARKGFHKDAIDSWKATLTRQEISIVERSCGSLMERYGYPIEADSRTLSALEARYILSYPLHVAAVLAVNPRRAWIQFRAAFRP